MSSAHQGICMGGRRPRCCFLIFPQGAGWAIVIGFGIFFAIFASALVYLDIAFSGEVSVQRKRSRHMPCTLWCLSQDNVCFRD
jgi:hypothetical protein